MINKKILFKINGKFVEEKEFHKKLGQIKIPVQPYQEAFITKSDSPESESESWMYTFAEGINKLNGKKCEITTTSFEDETTQEIIEK